MSATEILDAMYDHTPLIFGHSGAQAYAPSNTLPAFELVVRHGAPGTELDVNRTRDGYPVVLHDFTVDSTTNGTGRVTEMTLAEVKALDAGSWFGPEFAGVQIPTLDEVFEAVGKQLFINVEVKYLPQESEGLEQIVVDCIRRHAMEDRVIISSFSPVALRNIRDLMPDLPLGFLYGKDSPEIIYELIKDVPVEALHPEAFLIDAALVEKAHKEGQRVNAWTVNDTAEAKRLADLGVDAIITDVPDQLLAALR